MEDEWINEQTQDDPVQMVNMVLDQNHNRIYEDPLKTQQFYKDIFFSQANSFIFKIFFPKEPQPTPHKLATEKSP